MSKAETNYIVIGKIGSAYGIHGWLKVQAYTEFGANILKYKPWYISLDEDQWNRKEIIDGRPHGKGLIVKFLDINTPEQARSLTGHLVAVMRSQLPVLNKNEYYWTDLIGLTVINKHGVTLGKVIYLMETGSNDVLVIKNDKEYAIPYLLDEVILSVDLQQKQIIVDWELI